MKTSIYESPKMVFAKTELFENVAAECWANPSLYCLVDPTDEDKELGNNCNLKYADLANFTTTSNGCNNTMKEAVKKYLKDNYGPDSDFGKTNGHYLTGGSTGDQGDIEMIMASGGGNEGTSLKTSQYIWKVRS